MCVLPGRPRLTWCISVASFISSPFKSPKLPPHLQTPLFYEHSLIQSLECYSLFPCSWYLAGPCLLFFGWLLYTCFLTMSLVLFMFCLFGRKYCKPYPELHFNITNATPVQYHYLLSWSINCTLRMCFMIYMSNMCTFMMFKHLMKLLLFLVQDDCNNLCFRCW